MQRTRLNIFFDLVTNRILALFSNPWRKLSLILISLLLGIFIGTAVSTTTGQAAYWDITVAAMMLLLTEIISIIFYNPSFWQQRAKEKQNGIITRRSLFWEVLNTFKIGFTYSLFLEAFKLGS